jgi:hypothetical protein
MAGGWGAVLGYDVTLIAGQREALLARTLASFAKDVFPNFPIRRMIANIDRFMGDEAEGDRCEALILQYFPDATIFRPETPGFAAAVVRTWIETTAPRVLHLEDDWIALEPITSDRVEALFEGNVAAVTFLNVNKRTRRRNHQTVGRLVTRADGTVEKIDINAFSTSPGVFDGEFLREAARRMKPGLDPEKQFFLETNLHLEEHALPRRCMFLRGRTQFSLIEDIGRQARADAGLVKRYRDGASVWRQVGAEAPAEPEA